MVLHNAKTEEVGRFQLRVHRDMVVSDVLRMLRERAGASWEAKPLRLLKVRDSEIFKVGAPLRPCCSRLPPLHPCAACNRQVHASFTMVPAAVGQCKPPFFA